MTNLEGDDVLGILATASEEYIVWSLDKDLKQIPGNHLIDDEVVTISTADADRFHMYQTLVGDTSDGYKGCPGVGPVKADKILTGGWTAIVDAYAKAGLTENDAIHQARLARILRSGEYDEQTHEVTLWIP
jgi:DNA polymerase-1